MTYSTLNRCGSGILRGDLVARVVGPISRGRGRKAGILIRCDVLIVGGGPAGLAAAIALRQKGIEVLVARHQ